MPKILKNVDSIQRRENALFVPKPKLKSKSQKEQYFSGQAYTDFTRKHPFKKDIALLRKVGFAFSIITASITISVATQGFAFTRNEESTQTKITAETNTIPLGPIQTKNDSLRVIPVSPALLEQPKQPDPLEGRKEALREYLEEKGSPLAKYADTLAEQEHWKLIVGIASAESSLCQKYPASTYNCWGVGGAWNLHKYNGFSDAIVKVNALLDRKYYDLGLNTPSKMVKKWVGHPNDNWVAAVQQEISNLNSIQ